MNVDPATEAQLRLAAIVATSEDAIIGKDLDGLVTSWNRAAERIFGYSSAEAIGQSTRLTIPREWYEEERETLKRIRSGATIEHFETSRLHHDGRRIQVSL